MSLFSQWLKRRSGKRETSEPIDLSDPLNGATRDAEILIAYAAQSRRSIKPEKVSALIGAVDTIVSQQRAGKAPTSTERADFWNAYDAFAADMAPLSAVSIRSSMAANGRTFPFSLWSPTGANAGLAVAVFLLCLALQGFWVAGKELTERADALEAQRSELQQRMARNTFASRRAQGKSESFLEQICSQAKCDEFTGQPVAQPYKDVDQSRHSALRAEYAIAKAESAEKDFLSQEMNDELLRINERSRPLEVLLRRWHERARTVCDNRYLRFLCPVDNPREGSNENSELQRKAQILRSELDAIQDRMLSRSNDDRQMPSLTQRSLKQRELRKVEQDLLKAEEDRFRSIAVEVRIIVANIGTYLIAMVMGILGALTFILRSLSNQLRDHTYVPMSASISIVRICLGAIAGVFGSLLVPNGDTGLKSLPPLFVPFVFGYGIEILFSLLDKVVRSFTQTEPTGQQLQRP